MDVFKPTAFKPEILLKPFAHVLAETQDGVAFMKTFHACKNSIHQNGEKGIKMLLDALGKVLASTNVNREALLQWLEQNSTQQLLIMLHGRGNNPEIEGANSCQIMKNICTRWKLKTVCPEQYKLVYSQVNELFFLVSYKLLH